MSDERNSMESSQADNLKKADNPKKTENPDSDGSDERFESDTQKIVRRHMENENDVITDEDIRNVRVGMSPPAMDTATEARFEGDDKIDEVEEDFIGDTDVIDEGKASKKTITPWDTIEPED